MYCINGLFRKWFYLYPHTASANRKHAGAASLPVRVAALGTEGAGVRGSDGTHDGRSEVLGALGELRLRRRVVLVRGGLHGRQHLQHHRVVLGRVRLRPSAVAPTRDRHNAGGVPGRGGRRRDAGQRTGRRGPGSPR